MTLGQKIKALRKEKKITQSELCNSRITRNMLSAVENDRAYPSLDTLIYIAKRLGVPTSYLVSDDENLFFYEKRDAIKQIKDAFSEKKYSSCVHHISKLSDTDDELSYMLAVCHFELGKRAMLGGSLLTAQNHMKDARLNCERTVYDTGRIENLMLMYSALISNIQSPLLEFDAHAFDEGLDPGLDYELYKYMIGDTEFKYKNEVFSKHFRARELMKNRKYNEALRLLGEIIEEKRPDTYNAYVIFGVYSDMEQCAKQLASFETAYKYASKRLSMLEGFKS